MPEKKQIEMTVSDCTLMIEDKATITSVEMAFCENCEYHQGIELDQVLCSANDVLKAEDKEGA